MNNYEQEANVILKMTKVVHPDYVVNSIAQFLKERDTKQKLNIHSVGGPASASALEGEQLGNEAGDTVAEREAINGIYLPYAKWIY